MNISCEIQRYSSVIIWSHNAKQVAEDEKPYDSGFIEIVKARNRYDLIIRSATLAHRGNWKCRLGNADFSLQLNVSGKR